MELLKSIIAWVVSISSALFETIGIDGYLPESFKGKGDLKECLFAFMLLGGISTIIFFKYIHEENYNMVKKQNSALNRDKYYIRAGICDIVNIVILLMLANVVDRTDTNVPLLVLSMVLLVICICIFVDLSLIVFVFITEAICAKIKGYPSIVTIEMVVAFVAICLVLVFINIPIILCILIIFVTGLFLIIMTHYFKDTNNIVIKAYKNLKRLLKRFWNFIINLLKKLPILKLGVAWLYFVFDLFKSNISLISNSIQYSLSSIKNTKNNKYDDDSNKYGDYLGKIVFVYLLCICGLCIFINPIISNTPEQQKTNLDMPQKTVVKLEDTFFTYDDDTKSLISIDSSILLPIDEYDFYMKYNEKDYLISFKEVLSMEELNEVLGIE